MAPCQFLLYFNSFSSSLPSPFAIHRPSFFSNAGIKTGFCAAKHIFGPGFQKPFYSSPFILAEKSPLTVDLLGESGWRSCHQSRLPPLRPGIESARGLRFVDLNLTPRVFLRVLRFSSLCKFDFYTKI